jgi:hypothetical protein
MLLLYQSADLLLAGHHFSPPTANRHYGSAARSWPSKQSRHHVVGNCAALAVSAPVITKDADIFQLGPSLELGHALLKVLELFQIRQRRNSKAADRARGRFGRDKLLAKT